MLFARDGQKKPVCRAYSDPSMVTINASGVLTLERQCDVIYNCSLQKPVAFPFDHQNCRLRIIVENVGVPVKISWDKDTDANSGLQRSWMVSRLISGTFYV